MECDWTQERGREKEIESEGQKQRETDGVKQEALRERETEKKRAKLYKPVNYYS